MDIIDVNIFGDDQNELAKVLNSLKLELPAIEIEGVNRITTALKDYALRDIKEISKRDNVLASFILCSCFIEQIATYRYGTDNVGREHFKTFVEEYLPNYDAGKLRDDLRNKLVHNYSLGDTYFLTQRNPHVHLKYTSDGSVILNLEDFVCDLENALARFIQQLVTSAKIRMMSLRILSKNHIVGLSSLN